MPLGIKNVPLKISKVPFSYFQRPAFFLAWGKLCYRDATASTSAKFLKPLQYAKCVKRKKNQETPCLITCKNTFGKYLVERKNQCKERMNNRK